MRRTIMAAALVAAAALSPSASAAGRPGCPKLFTVPMGHRAARAIYSGTRRPTLPQLRLLGQIERCQRNPAVQPSVRDYDRHRDAVQRDRILRASMSYAGASFYYDAGATASGWHAYYGVANKYLPFGTRVTFYWAGRSVTAVVDDRGPYVAGRDWDLNEHVAAALAFNGLGTVGYRID